MTAEEYKRSAEALIDSMRTREGEWRWLREHINPQSIPASENSDQPRSGRQNRKICFAAWQASVTLAGAHCMYIMPPGQRWFSLKSAVKDKKKKSVAYDEWFAFATEALHAELSRSNFYTVNQQEMLERVQLGTGCSYVGMKPDGTLGFIYVPVGTFGIGEDEYRTVNKIARVFKLTADQAVERWGLTALPEEVKRDWEDLDKRYTEQREYLHLVVPNPNAQGAMSGRNYLSRPSERKFLSVYMSWETAEKKIMEESGYDEFPYFVTRFLPDGTSAYGAAPGSAAMIEMMRYENLEKVMDTLGEVAAHPRMLMLEKQVGQIDFRAGGKTVVRRADAALGYPREWGTSGRYDVGKDRIADKESKIRSAFFEPMLSVFSGIEREMSATEVVARQEEKTIAFVPSFTLLLSDLNTLLRRVFALMLRAGKLDNGTPYPEELLEVDEMSGEIIGVKLPEVSFNSKIAQAIERVQANGASQYMAHAMEVAGGSGDRSMLDIIDMTKYGRLMYESMGADTACMRSEREVEKLQAARDEAAAQAQATEMQAAQAKAARDGAAAVGQLTVKK